MRAAQSGAQFFCFVVCWGWAGQQCGARGYGTLALRCRIVGGVRVAERLRRARVARGIRVAAEAARGLRYSSHTARSGLGLARVVRRFVWPRHANGVLSTTPLDPCACEMGAQGGNKRRTGHAALRGLPVRTSAAHRVVGLEAALVVALRRAGSQALLLLLVWLTACS